MLRAVKIRLYPNKKQATQFNKLLGCYRVVYNQCLNRKINSYKEKGVSENLTTLGHFIHHELLKDDNFAWLREQNSKVLKQATHDVMSAFKNFFENNAGFPNFKQKHANKQSCRFEIQTISKRNVYTNYKISLANIKNVKFKCNKKSAEYLEKHKDCIKQATLKRLPCGEYYLSILVDGNLMRQVKEADNCIGIDLGVKDFVTTSEGTVFGNPHFKKSEFKKIKHLQRLMSSKRKGSKNYGKARVRLATAYKKIDDRQQNYLHTVSNSLIDENQVICMEDLNVKGMVKNHNLAESILEMNFGEFRRMLKYKARWYNRRIVFVDRFYPSSKTCHECGHVNRGLTLKDREWVCPHCGKVVSRDFNASLNILDEGLRIIGCSTPEYRLVEGPTMDGPTVDGCSTENSLLKSSVSVKQEVNKAQGSTLCKF